MNYLQESPDVFTYQIHRLDHLLQQTIYVLERYRKQGNQKMIAKHRTKMFNLEDQIQELQRLQDDRETKDRY
jgi:hypothetical protein